MGFRTECPFVPHSDPGKPFERIKGETKTMKKIVTLAAMLGLATSAFALPTGQEASILVGPGSFAATPNIRDMVVDASGTIYAVDSGAGNIVSIVPDPSDVDNATVTELATFAEIFTEIDNNNGTSSATAFNGRGIGLDSSGDVVVSGYLSDSDGDSVVVIANDGSSISVLYTPQNADTSLINGIEAIEVLGDTVLVATSVDFGDANALFTIDTTATGPTAAVTTLVDEAGLTAVTGLSGEDTSLNDLSSDGTNFFGTVSKTGSANDDILQITPAGAVSVYVADSDITADLAAIDAAVTDVGYAALTLDGDGDVWLLNPFGDGSFDAGVIESSNITAPNGSADGITGADLDSQIGSNGAFLANDTLAYDSDNDQVLFFEGDTDAIIAIPASVTSSVGNWQVFD